MAEPAWFEVTAVVRATPELLAQARSALEDSGLVELDTWEVTQLDTARCRWDGSAAGTRLGVPEPNVFDLLRQGHELHELPRPGEPTLNLLERD